MVVDVTLIGFFTTFCIYQWSVQRELEGTRLVVHAGNIFAVFAVYFSLFLLLFWEIPEFGERSFFFAFLSLSVAVFRSFLREPESVCHEAHAMKRMP